MTQLVHTMFLSNNGPSFHLWWKENLVKHREVSKYYETDCLQNFILLFMLLLTTKFVKTIIFRIEFCLSCEKNVLKQTWHSFNTKFQTQWKDREKSYHVTIIWGLFCHSIALILGLNSLKDLRVTKNVKEIKFGGVSGELESKKVPEKMTHKICKTNFCFHVK